MGLERARRRDYRQMDSNYGGQAGGGIWSCLGELNVQGRLIAVLCYAMDSL